MWIIVRNKKKKEKKKKTDTRCVIVYIRRTEEWGPKLQGWAACTTFHGLNSHVYSKKPIQDRLVELDPNEDLLLKAAKESAMDDRDFFDEVTEHKLHHFYNSATLQT